MKLGLLKFTRRGHSFTQYVKGNSLERTVAFLQSLLCKPLEIFNYKHIVNEVTYTYVSLHHTHVSVCAFTCLK